MAYQKHDLPAACPHCGNPFTIPAGTFTLLNSGGVMQCNVCHGTFFCHLKSTGALAYRNPHTFQHLTTWVGPPLHPDKVAQKDGTMGRAPGA